MTLGKEKKILNEDINFFVKFSLNEDLGMGMGQRKRG